MPIIIQSENAIAQLVERMITMISLLKAWVQIPLPTTDFLLFSEKRGVYHPNVFSLPPPLNVKMSGFKKTGYSPGLK